MPHGKLNNAIYRALLPLGPSPRGRMAHESAGRPLTDPAGYERLLLRHHVLGASLLLRDELKRLGAEVLMTRETHDVDISNIERALMMNEWGADAVVRVHLNGSTNKDAHGIGMYVRNTGACAEESGRLARCLLDALRDMTDAHIQGVYRRDTYTGLNWSEVPCVLAELGYMTNPDEDKNTARAEYQLLLAQGIAKGICLYFEGAAAEPLG